ncbi:MAG TPA: hypothetical protein PLH23_08510 [Hyphomonadaceae bacterium]|nr:hypothetical protein [Hyphomonadaceae bacterium]
MLSKLTRILLAICTAFVFTGQMEAAAQHCARLALLAEHGAAVHESAVHATVEQHHAVKAETPSCHDSAAAAEAKAAHYPTHNTNQPADHCECIAALKMCASLPAATASHRIAPYAWLTTGATPFVSTEPTPDWRPPRA